MAEDKQEPLNDAAMSSIEAGVVEAPYSIYSSKEKWIIVGMVALAGFYRYVLDSEIVNQDLAVFRVFQVLG
jgi:hypothetical protein